MNKLFPTYKNSEIAIKWGCFHCCHKPNPQTIQKTDYPKGSYAFKCPKCELWTFFDLENEEVTV